jgi:hypothetical protein
MRQPAQADPIHQRKEAHGMTTWLVTGGAGFIGGNFVLGAVRDGIRVVNLDALTYAGNRDTLASLDGDPTTCSCTATSATANWSHGCWPSIAPTRW